MKGENQYTARQYDDDRGDLECMRRLIVETATTRDPPVADLHPGDLTWQRFMLEDQLGRWSERVRLWEDGDGRLAGFAIYYDRSVELLPVLRDRILSGHALLGEMIEWGEQCAEEPGGLRIVLSPTSALAPSFLAYQYRQTDDPAMKLTVRPLDDIPFVLLPGGFAVRALHGESEYEERVSIHREAFHPSRVTLQAYRRLRVAPGYDPDLDLVCVAPDGTFASYCIAWYDPDTRVGEFEPVGARVAFRRKGLTRAVMTEGLRRLKARGATSAIVSCDTDNPAACALYESLGFRELDRWVSFARAAG